MHLGHAKLLQRVRDRAAGHGTARRRPDLRSPSAPGAQSPKTPRRPSPLIEQEARMLRGQRHPGWRWSCPLPRELAAREPEDFVREVLVAGLCLKHLVIGYDLRLRQGAQGQFRAALRAWASSMVFSVERPRSGHHQRRRGLLHPHPGHGPGRQGLGRAAAARGASTRCGARSPTGSSAGAKLGFPTANVAVRDELVPLPGVYAVWVETGGAIRPGGGQHRQKPPPSASSR